MRGEIDFNADRGTVIAALRAQAKAAEDAKKGVTSETSAAQATSKPRKSSKKTSDEQRMNAQEHEKSKELPVRPGSGKRSTRDAQPNGGFQIKYSRNVNRETLLRLARLRQTSISLWIRKRSGTH